MHPLIRYPAACLGRNGSRGGCPRRSFFTFSLQVGQRRDSFFRSWKHEAAAFPRPASPGGSGGASGAGDNGLTSDRGLLYADRDDLNSLWWDLVERLQLVKRPAGRDEPDWAAKIHVAVAPVYYPTPRLFLPA
jgi:hypothetical protein